MSTRAVVTMALAGSLVGCADGGPAPSAPEETQLAGPQLGPPSLRCKLGFALMLDETRPMRSDRVPPNHPYQNKVDQVLIGTDGTGLRFDTNGSQQHEASSDIRRVRLDFAGTGYEAHADPAVPKGIDFRFDHNTDPINLCGLQIDQSDIVSGGLTFVSSATGGLARLRWGGVNPASDPDHDCAAQGVSGFTVTRTKQNEWHVSGGAACFYSGFLGGVFQEVIAMPIAFTITAQTNAPLP